MGEKKLGKYRGFVTDNDDPEERGRIKARVPALLGDDNTDWAEPCFPYAGSDVGDVFIPEIDDMVWMEFEAGDINKPIWVGSPLAQQDTPSDIKDNYPEQHIIKTDSGHKIIFDDSEDDPRLIIEHESGTSVTHFNKDTASGSINFDVNGDMEGTIGGNFDFTSNSNVNIEAGLSMNLTSDGSTDISSELATNIRSNEDVVVDSPLVHIGSGEADEDAVLGNELVSKLKDLIDAINNITVPTAFGPSGNPINEAEFKGIKNTLNQFLSKKITVE